ncbi:MAG: type II toxin-antitoxin system RelE/ParE family toxin [Halodesulfurarchaeum sp.]|nr:type II toxin-antitoxin system RelE/ParE family toxin [Halodesulfurarchaeum sp.]
MTGDDDWGWKMKSPAKNKLESLQNHDQQRIVSKLDEIVTDQWRDPSGYVEPLTGMPHSKLRIGPFRLGCEVDHDTEILWIYTIEKRSGAYKPGDD